MLSKRINDAETWSSGTRAVCTSQQDVVLDAQADPNYRVRPEREHALALVQGLAAHAL